MNVHVYIERLILDGIPLSPDQRPILQATIESELSRLVEEQGWLRSNGNTHIHRVTGAPVQFDRSPDATSLGQQIARSVYGGSF